MYDHEAYEVPFQFGDSKSVKNDGNLKCNGSKNHNIGGDDPTRENIRLNLRPEIIRNEQNVLKVLGPVV